MFIRLNLRLATCVCSVRLGPTWNSGRHWQAPAFGKRNEVQTLLERSGRDSR